MLTVTRKEGATSTADKGRTGTQKGNKGRLELFASKSTDGTCYTVSFVDYGNFGRERWSADFGRLTDAQLTDMIEALEALRAGNIDTTHAPFEQVLAQESAPYLEPVETTAEAVDDVETM